MGERKNGGDRFHLEEATKNGKGGNQARTASRLIRTATAPQGYPRAKARHESGTKVRTPVTAVDTKREHRVAHGVGQPRRHRGHQTPRPTPPTAPRQGRLGGVVKLQEGALGKQRARPHAAASPLSHLSTTTRNTNAQALPLVVHPRTLVRTFRQQPTPLPVSPAMDDVEHVEEVV